MQARVAAASETPKRVYVELGNKGPGTHGNSYGDLMWGGGVNMAGGENIAKDQVAKWAPLNPEFVVAQDPQIILFAGSGWLSRDEAVVMGPGVDRALTHDRIRPYLGRPGWDSLSAVKNGEVYGVYHGGARTLYDYTYLQYVAKAVYPEAFADVDPQETLKRFFNEYLPIEAQGAYMTKLPN